MPYIVQTAQDLNRNSRNLASWSVSLYEGDEAVTNGLAKSLHTLDAYNRRGVFEDRYQALQAVAGEVSAPFSIWLHDRGDYDRAEREGVADGMPIERRYEMKPFDFKPPQKSVDDWEEWKLIMIRYPNGTVWIG